MLVTVAGILIAVKALQPQKAELPMLLTLGGRLTLAKELQLQKVDVPMVMLVTLEGMLILVSEQHWENT